MYNSETIYIVGSTKTINENNIASKNSTFYIGFVVESKTHKIIDVSSDVTLRTTDEFIRSIFIEKSILTYDKTIENNIKNRYLGPLQNSIIAAYKDAVIKYRDSLEEHKLK